jgi:hypothetical protein
MLQFHNMSEVVDLSASKLWVQCTGRAIYSSCVLTSSPKILVTDCGEAYL